LVACRAFFRARRCAPCAANLNSWLSSCPLPVVDLPPSGGVHCSTPQSTTAATGGEGGGEEEEEKKNAEEGEVNTGYSYAMGAARGTQGACG